MNLKIFAANFPFRTSFPIERETILITIIEHVLKSICTCFVETIIWLIARTFHESLEKKKKKKEKGREKATLLSITRERGSF